MKARIQSISEQDLDKCVCIYPLIAKTAEDDIEIGMGKDNEQKYIRTNGDYLYVEGEEVASLKGITNIQLVEEAHIKNEFREVLSDSDLQNGVFILDSKDITSIRCENYLFLMYLEQLNLKSLLTIYLDLSDNSYDVGAVMKYLSGVPKTCKFTLMIDLNWLLQNWETENEILDKDICCLEIYEVYLNSL